ncbi:MAG: hypothetical protein KDB02_05640 [Acidimicrobiales bacterium]|nr:hypothetical protein [Acidimicrobiales bacterium]
MTSIVESTSDAFVAGLDYLRDPRHQRVALATYELIATGKPARVDRIAEGAGVDIEEVEEWMSDWPAVFRDEDGAITGFFGLSVNDGFAHRFDTDEYGRAWTWCTYDPLFIAKVLGVTARVSSNCPVTGTPVTLTVTPEGVRDLDPPTAVMSMLPPDRASFRDLITTLCHFIWLFETAEAAESWTAQNPGTFVISVDEGFEIGRRMTDQVFDSPSSPL